MLAKALRRSKTLKVCLTTTFVTLVLVSAMAGQHRATRLELGDTVEVQLDTKSSSAAHIILLRADELFLIEVKQRGTNVSVRLIDPMGKPVVTVNNPNGTQSSELIVHPGGPHGDCRIEVFLSNGETRTGRYSLTVNRLQRANATNGDFVLEGQLLKAEADALMEREPKATAKAAELYEAAADLLSRSGNDEVIGPMYLLLGNIFDDILYRRERALEFYSGSITALERTGASAQLADVHNAKGRAFENIVSYTDAIESYKKALEIGSRIGDRGLQARTYNQLGRGYARLGDFDTSLTQFLHARSLNEGAKWNQDVSVTLMGLANVYNALGDFSRALESGHHNVRLLTQNGATRQIPAQLLNIGNMYLGQGDYDQAGDFYQRALEGFEAMNSAAVGVSYALTNLGGVFAYKGDYVKALEYLERSRQMKTKFMTNDPGSLSEIARVHRLQGRYDDAIDYYRRSLALAERSEDRNLVTGILGAMSETFYLQGDYAKSLDLATRAVQIGAQENSWIAYALAGRAKSSLGDMSGARNDLEIAVSKIEEARKSGIYGVVPQGHSSENIGRAYQSLVDVLSRQGETQLALAYAERARGRMLSDIVRLGRAGSSKSLSADDRERERTLKNGLSLLNIQVAAAKDPATIRRLNALLSARRLEFDDFNNRMNAAQPDLAVHRGEMRNISLTETTEMLDGGRTALVEYVLTEDKLISFVITEVAGKPKLSTYTIAVDPKVLERKVEEFRKRLASRNLGFQRISRELFDLLIKPIASELGGASQVVVVPDGPLWELPFQGLTDQRNKYLVERLAISYAPSLTALREFVRRARGVDRRGQSSLLAFGNPVAGVEPDRGDGHLSGSNTLGAIPETDRLVNRLRQIYGVGNSRIFTGSNALEAMVKSEAPKYRTIQFATHAVLNSSSPMYSHLVFARDDTDPGDDGRLEAWELRDLKLNADIVILSACETARGKITDGEGMIGMTWASFNAGASATLASQWKVESSSTTELMLEFHRQLLRNEKISKAEALRRASLKLLRVSKYRHPFYWAGFVIVGDAS